MKLKQWQFYICLDGVGRDVEDAWSDATQGFDMDPGPTPPLAPRKIINRCARIGLSTPCAVRNPEGDIEL